jgi:hypothetical protein
VAGIVSTLFFVAAGLLAWSGVTKVLRPDAASAALTAARLPGGRSVGRTLGLFEAGLGLWCLAAPAPAGAALLATAYLAFAGFVVLLLRSRTPVSSCGCLGGEEAPPSVGHVAVDLTMAAFGFAAAVAPRFPGLVSFVVHLRISGAVYVIGLVAAVYLASVVTAALPAQLLSYRGKQEAAR